MKLLGDIFQFLKKNANKQMIHRFNEVKIIGKLEKKKLRVRLA